MTEFWINITILSMENLIAQSYYADAQQFILTHIKSNALPNDLKEKLTILYNNLTLNNAKEVLE